MSERTPTMPEDARNRQLPPPGRIFLDHVAWMVPDMEAAAARFERLGFLLTPFSVHGDRDPRSGALVATGSANRLAMLPIGYLEILTAAVQRDGEFRHLLADTGHPNP